MNPEPNPEDSLYPLQPSPSPEKNRQFSTPTSNINPTKDCKWVNQRIAKKEVKSLYEKGLQTVSKKLTFDENLRNMNEIRTFNNEDPLKILKLR